MKSSAVSTPPEPDHPRRRLLSLAALLHVLHERTIVVLTLMFCAGVGVMLWTSQRLSTKLVRAAALQGATLQAELIEHVRLLYTSEVVERVRPLGAVVT